MSLPVQRSLADHYQEVFKALGDAIRIRMLTMIAAADELPCTALEAELPISKSTISYHVRILRAAGLIAVRKDGRHYHYRAEREVIEYFVPDFLARMSN